MISLKPQFYPHLQEMPIYARKYEPGIIWKFDSVSDLREFDNQFLNNVDSAIMTNICDILHCEMEEIGDINVLANGRTNLSFSFTITRPEGKKKYVYRNSGDTTDKYINRRSEAFSCNVARDLELDPSLVFMDQITGFKIMEFIEATKEFDFTDSVDIQKGLDALHKLQDSNIQSPISI